MIMLYVSGPISNGGTLTIEERYRNAEASYEHHRLFTEQGIAVVNPLLTQHVDPAGEVAHETWLKSDFEIISRCDAVYRIPGRSSGADAECEYAIGRGIPVFHWAADVLEYAKQRDAESVLDVAKRIAGVSRSRDYGHPLANHERIARLWNAYIANNPSDTLSPEDVAWMMVLMKVAREQNTHKADNLVDVVGYVRCVELMTERRSH